jgi:hypothetical protein
MPTSPTSNSTTLRSALHRGTVLLIFVALTAITFFLFCAASPLALNRLLSDGALALAWLTAAAGIGGMFLPRRGWTLLDVVTAIALGLGVIGLVVLVLGLMGWLNGPIAFAVIAIGVAFTTAQLIRSRITLVGVQAWFRTPSTWLVACAFAAPFLGLALAAALIPPGILWSSDEPNGYDVVEYHLQIPREWHEAGRITRLDHNVFSYFPQGVEMHYLLAMHLRGGAWEGMYLAQLMHVAFVALSVIAVYAAARSFAEKGPAMIAALAAASTPWMALLGPIAYNEGGLLLYGTLAIAWAMQAQRNDFERKHVALASVMAGFACGAKLTAGPVLLIGIPLAWLIASRSFKRVAVASALLILIALAMFSPWMMRTAAWAGNPVFPEAQNVLGRGRFTADQSQRWARAHAPTESQRSVSGRLAALREQVLLDWRFGYIILPLAIVAAVMTRQRAQTRMLAALLVVLLIFWLTMTHLQGRFFVLAIPIAGLLIAQLDAPRVRIAAVTLVALQAMISLSLIFAKLAPTVAVFRDASGFGITNLDFMVLPETTEAIAAGVPLDLVGDAKAFVYQMPMAKLRYRTVFDVKAEPNQSAMDAWLGSPREGAAILVDPGEVRRLSRTYYAIPSLPADVSEAGPFLMRPSPPPR